MLFISTRTGVRLLTGVFLFPSPSDGTQPGFFALLGGVQLSEHSGSP